tara:strand:- start:114 stop:338 length:225 start_codon:yes stop_codon:yes gene_type:complete
MSPITGRDSLLTLHSGTQTCTLTNPEFKIPVTGYSEGPWILGYGAMALDGTYLPDCGERRPPWVEDPETCDETK